jgi:hypothetical protein
MLCKVYDGIFDDLYIHQIDAMMRDTVAVYPNNIANRTSWPYGYEGSHHLLGRVVFDRKSLNRITILHPSAQTFFDMFEQIETKMGMQMYLSQIQVNLQHAGFDGTTHIDSDSPDDLTILVMTTPKWESECGGQFQLTTWEGDVVEEYDYRPGRVLVIPSNHPHRGLGPIKKYSYRTTVVFRATP